MKLQSFFTTLAVVALVSCSSYDSEPMLLEEPSTTTAIEDVRQITEDVNSAEVNNILTSLFSNKKGRSDNGYTVSLLKNSAGKDCIICVNYDNNGGFALISAKKTHEPILAYAEEGNFTIDNELPFPLNEWMSRAMNGITESESLSTDSLNKIADIWHRYENLKPFLKSRADQVDPDHSRLVYLSYEEYLDLFHKMKPYIDSWSAEGNRVYSIDDYQNGLSFGDKYQLAGYVQGNIFAAYSEDYWAVTVVREVDHGNTFFYGKNLNVEWNQSNGYNQRLGLIPGSDTERYPVGCVPVAVGQLMYGFKYPTFYNWAQMPSYGRGNMVVSDFLFDVFTKCKSTHRYDAARKMYVTGTSIKDMEDALKQYGYSFEHLKGSSISSNIIYNLPAIMNSEFTQILNGKETPGYHAWIIESGRLIESYTTVEIWTFTYPDEFKCIYSENINFSNSKLFYVNWGWGGSYNANFTFNYMLPNRDYTQNYLKDAYINFSHQ